MNIWQQLGIQPTGDIRAIKKAYAGRLKHCRPDEKPVEFQQLHGAYQQALNQAKRRARQAAGAANSVATEETVAAEIPAAVETRIAIDAQSVIEPHVDEQRGNPPLREAEDAGVLVEEDVLDEQPVDSPETAAEEIRRESYEEICRRQLRLELEKVDALLARREKHEPESWDFLVQNPLMLDDRFNFEMGLAVLHRIGEYHLAMNNSRKKYERLSGRVLNHLNGFFRWRESESYVRQRLEENVCNRVFPHLQDDDEQSLPVFSYIRGAKSVKTQPVGHNGPLKVYYFANGSQRLFAMFVDIILFVFLLGSVFGLADRLVERDITKLFVDEYLVYLMTGVYVIAAWLFECSRLQATPGKMLFGLKVTDTGYGRLGYWQGLWRTFTFSVTALGTYLTALVNCLLKGRYLHDRLSRSLVIDYRRSKSTQRKRRG